MGQPLGAVIVAGLVVQVELLRIFISLDRGRRLHHSPTQTLAKLRLKWASSGGQIVFAPEQHAAASCEHRNSEDSLQGRSSEAPLGRQTMIMCALHIRAQAGQQHSKLIRRRGSASVAQRLV